MEKYTIKNLVNKILFEDYSTATEILNKILLEKQLKREALATKLVTESVEDLPEDMLIEPPEDADLLGIDEKDEEEADEKAVCFTTANKDIIDLFENGFVKLTITKVGLNGTEETVDFDFSELANVSVMDLSDDEEDIIEDEGEESDESDDVEEEDVEVEEAEDEDTVEEGATITEDGEAEDEEQPTEREGLVDPMEDVDQADATESEPHDEQEVEQENAPETEPVASDVDDSQIVVDEPAENNGNGPDNQEDLDSIANNMAEIDVKTSIGRLELAKEKLFQFINDLSNVKLTANEKLSDVVDTTISDKATIDAIKANATIEVIEKAKDQLYAYIQNKIDNLNSDVIDAENVDDKEFSKIDEKIEFLTKNLLNVKEYLGIDNDELDDIATDAEVETGIDDSVDASETDGTEEGGTTSDKDSEESESTETEEETTDAGDAEEGKEADSAEQEETDETSEEDK